MASAAAYRGRAGSYEACAGTAVAIYLDGREEPRIARSSPLTTPDGLLLLVADARIDNREEMATLLDVAEVASRHDDSALLLEAYRRWGESFADRLIGDFSVVVWDVPRRRVVAARDQQGLRPLFYRMEPSRILVASEVKQILAVDGVPARPHEERIAAMLAGSPGLPEWTFYEGVRRLPPGHTLVVDERGARVRDRRSVSRGRAVARSADDCARDLRSQLTQAVRDRLDVSAVPGLLLSGGLDSTSIAGIAGTLGRTGSTTPALLTYSFAHDDLIQCDERDVSDVVARHYGFPNTPVPASDAWPLAGHPQYGPDIDGPDRFRSHVVMGRSLDLARRDGVKVLMSGQRGDALLGGDVVDYLGRLRDAGPLAVWRDLTRHSARSGRSRRSLINMYVLRRAWTAAWPRDRAAGARQRVRALAGSGNEGFPPWLRKEAIDRFNLRDVVAQAEPRSSMRGEARRRRHLRMLDPQVGRNTEAMERRFAQAGMRYADPWADSRLADLVLQIPQYLITPAGESKWLLREAMRGVLPEAARLAAKKRSPQPVYERGLADRASETVLSLIDHSLAAARGYVDEAAVRAAYSRFRAQSGRVTEREWRHLWRFIDVEDWLRRFHG